jgi:hypothetical protein
MNQALQKVQRLSEVEIDQIRGFKMKQYKIRDGFSFREDNGEVKSGGEVIGLPDDVAANHLHKLELVDGGGAKEPEKRGGKKLVEPAPADPVPVDPAPADPASGDPQ